MFKIKPTLVLAAAGLVAASAMAAPDSIVTASERGTYIEIGRDLSRLVAQPAGLQLEVLPSTGSAENVRRLRSEPGVRLALVQSDVYQSFVDEARLGSADAGRLVKPLRVVMPLYDEEIHFVVRADSPLRHIGDIRGKRINVGPVGSGSALTATTLYRAMFGTALPEQNASYLSNEEALLKLATDPSIDVAVIVAGQPAKLFADMKKEARQYIKLLDLDPQAPESRAAGDTYAQASIRAGSYPNWLAHDVPTLAVKSMLVTYDYQSPALRDSLTRFAHSMCDNFARLKSEGHAKWQQVSLGQPPLAKGWSYYAPTAAVLANCSNAAPRGVLASSTPIEAACTQSQRMLGLCQAPR